MEDERKTKKQLIEELNELRKSDAELKSCKAEINQLRADQEKFTKAFLQSSVPATISTLKEGRFVEVSNAYLALARCKRDEVIGRTSVEVGAITEEQRSLIINELNKNGRVENMEMVIGTKGGVLRNGLLNSVMMNIADKKYLLSVMTDITDLRQAEEALKEKEEMLSLITENMSDMIRVTDLQGVNLYASPSHLTGLGYRPEERLGKTGFDIAHPDDLPMLINEFAKGLAGTEPMKRVEYRVKHADGHYIWLDTILNILRDDQGQVKSIVMSSRDITDRKRAEEMLAKSEEKYRTITENIMDCIVLEDAKGIFQYVINCREILGYEPEEMIGKTGLSFCHPDERTREINLYRGALGKEWQEIIYETRIRHKNGHYISIEVNTRALRDAQGEFIGAVCTARDTAHHQRMLKELVHTTKPFSASPLLSLREKEILGWVMQGKSTWDIATILDISERTVKFHVNSTMKKLSAVNRTHAVAIALRDELI